MILRNAQGNLTFFSLVILFTFLILPFPASACSCARPPDPLTAKDLSAAVFTGKVLGAK
ncbi:hypothetical protein DES34_12082 [Brevibacillus brevis]|nr:hypothetical protein DES34_12082 [Brevibacillus brevis]GEC91741.1 hypothetical protein BBR01nite_40720 [Brevibacillus brevis]VEF87372.1 Uncharacterised protein [Brevibacillus brevis]